MKPMTNKIETTDGMLFSDYTNAIQDYIQSCINDAMNTQTQKTTEAIVDAMKVRHIGQTFEDLQIPKPNGNNSTSSISKEYTASIPNISSMHFGIIQVQLCAKYVSESSKSTRIFHFIRKGNSLSLYDDNGFKDGSLGFSAHRSSKPYITCSLSDVRFTSDGFHVILKGDLATFDTTCKDDCRVGCTIDIYAW